MKLLLTGATGKVGTRFLQRFFEEERFSHGTVRAFATIGFSKKGPGLKSFPETLPIENLLAKP